MRYGLTQSNRGECQDRSAFPAQSSVLDEHALFSRVVCHYPLSDPLGCQFFSRGDSDVYKVHSAENVYYLKIYRPPHTEDQAEAEAGFVTDLHAAGAAVVLPVARRDGRYATPVEASEGLRPALLFESAPAAGFTPDDIESCRDLGRAVAELHGIADGLTRRHDLRVFDSAMVARERLPFAKIHLTPADFEFLVQLLDQVGGILDTLPTEPPHFGPCHGDLALSNVRQRPDGKIVFFDFGDAAFTWRAYELSAARARLPGDSSGLEASPHRDAFLAGYSSVRGLPEGVQNYNVALVLYRRLLWFCSAFAACPLRMGTEGFSRKFVDSHLPGIREMAGNLAGVAK